MHIRKEALWTRATQSQEVVRGRSFMREFGKCVAFLYCKVYHIINTVLLPTNTVQ